MIDTVVILLDTKQFTLTNPDLFKPSARWTMLPYTNQLHGIQSKQNPSKKELACGTYKPRLTLAQRINPVGGTTTSLKIELSLPKLMFGNNFDELRAKDFVPLTHRLAEVLATMGVQTTPSILAKAHISTVHYSKNILLTDGSTPYHYINKFKEANIKLSLDVNQTDYRNEGHSYKWHCNSYEVVFYDKIKDLEKARASSKRALEKDSDIQLNFLNRFESRNKLEILRMEVRLNKRQKIKQLFKKLAISADLTLKSLFKPMLSKKILLHYLNELESKRPALLHYKASNDKDLLGALFTNNPHLNPKQLLATFGLAKALETIPLRELRTIFTQYNQRSWYRLLADAQKVKLPAGHDSFAVLKEAIGKFKPVTLKV